MLPRSTAAIAAGALALALVSGCGHALPLAGADPVASPTLSTCGTAIDWLSDPSLAGEDDAQSQIPSAAVKASYSPRALRVAEAIGVIDELDDLVASAGTGNQTAELISKRQALLERLDLAKADISAAAVAADCEQGRADLLRDSLKDHETSRTRALTIASLGVGALTSIAAGAWSLADRDASRGPAAVGIAGGALGAVLGAMALTTSGSRVYLAHPRNQLRELWTNPLRSSLFSPSVWHFLSKKRGAGDPDSQKPTPREQMTARWKSNGMLGSDDETRAHRIALFFGEGGDYDLGELRDRADMLDGVQAEVDLMNQELELLLRQFSRRASAKP